MTLHRPLNRREPQRAVAATAAVPQPSAQTSQGFWIALGLATPLALIAGWWLGHLGLDVLVAWLAPGADRAVWYFTRAAGSVAYLLLSGSTIWGLILSSRIVADHVPPALALALHNSLAWLAISFATLHALALLGDGYYSYRVVDLLVPFVGPYRPLWVGLGTLGLYGAVLTSASFGLRRWIGQRLWRRLHALTFVVYAFATLHGLLAGTDSATPGARALYLASALAVFFLSAYRLLARHQERAQRPATTHPHREPA